MSTRKELLANSIDYCDQISHLLPRLKSRIESIDDEVSLNFLTNSEKIAIARNESYTIVEKLIEIKKCLDELVVRR